MLQALLSGKLSREQENMEDLLTSSVLGMFVYAPSDQGLLPFLANTVSLDGTRPFPRAMSASAVEWTFWPFWEQEGCVNCEPDVQIRFKTLAGQTHLVCIEAKYWSAKSNGPSSAGLVDQLAIQWDHLVRFASKSTASPTLIYLTTHASMPRDEMEESIRDYQRVRPDDRQLPNICWLSWRWLPELFRTCEEPTLRDVARLAERLNLRFFEGFSPVTVAQSFIWTFHRRPRLEWSWAVANPALQLNWGFSNA